MPDCGGISSSVTACSWLPPVLMRNVLRKTVLLSATTGSHQMGQ